MWLRDIDRRLDSIGLNLPERESRRPHLAMSRVDAVLTLNPGFAQARLVRGKVLEQLHRYRDSDVEFVEAGKLFGERKSLPSVRAHALALAGENDKALKIVRDLESASNQRVRFGHPHSPGVLRAPPTG